MNTPDNRPGMPPWLKAGLIAGAGLALLEVVSNLLPVVGFILTEPLVIVVDYLQGVLAAHYTRQDGRFRPAQRVSQAAISGLATGVVLAAVFTLLTYGILVPVTFGGALAALPFSIANSLFDITLNVALASLGAWWYGRLGRKGFVVASAAALGCALLGFCLLLAGGAALVAALGLDGVRALIHLPWLATPIPH